MKEARNSECIIEGIEPEIFKQLLRFFYSGKLPEDIVEVSVKLFEAAHYYEIEQLKEICRQQLPLLKTENALEIFNWASIYDEDEMKIKAWAVIKLCVDEKFGSLESLTNLLNHSDILNIFVAIENEPPTELQKMIEQKNQGRERVRTASSSNN